MVTRCVQWQVYLVGGVVSVGVDGLYDHVAVQEVGGDDVGHEGRVLFLEHDGHDVVADVSFLLQLRAGTEKMD